MHHSHTHTQRNSNTKHRPSQTNYHPLTNNNQPKDKNIVILRININGIRNKIEELKNLVHSTQSDIITIQETKLTQKAKHTIYPTTPPYAQTESTNKEGVHHTDQGRHNLHKHEHTQGQQHTQQELQLIKIHIGKTKDTTVANTFHQETRRHHTTTPWTQTSHIAYNTSPTYQTQYSQVT